MQGIRGTTRVEPERGWLRVIPSLLARARCCPLLADSQHAEREIVSCQPEIRSLSHTHNVSHAYDTRPDARIVKAFGHT